MISHLNPISKTGQEFIILDNIRKSNEVFKNPGGLRRLRRWYFNLDFNQNEHYGGDVLAGLNKAVDIAEKDFQGLVIGNQGSNFSVGANIGMIFMMAVEQEYDELNMAIKYFQDTMMRMRYSAIPTIVAPHGMTLGGGWNYLCMLIKLSNTYIGLVNLVLV